MDERSSRPDPADGDPRDPVAPRHLSNSASDPDSDESAVELSDNGTASPLPDKRSARRARRKERRPSPWWEFPVLIAIAILVAIGVKTWLVQPFYIPSASMEKTLHGCTGCNGDRILVNKPVYHLHDPRPGDIVVFHLPEAWNDSPSSQEVAQSADGNVVSKGFRWFGQLIGFIPPNGKILVKRVIAVGGQTVRCCDAQGRVQISDSGPGGPWRSLDEPYIYDNSADGVPAAFGPVTIPEGRLWVMGDHRNDSADSKYHYAASGSTGTERDATRATVSNDDVIGKAILIIWPYSRWRTLGTPETFAAMGGSATPSIFGAFAVLPLGWGLRRRRRIEQTCSGPTSSGSPPSGHTSSGDSPSGDSPSVDSPSGDTSPNDSGSS